jgi:hypothetical protein
MSVANESYSEELFEAERRLDEEESNPFHIQEPAPESTGEPWFVDAADLLAEPDSGPVPWLVEGLIVDQALTAAVGRWKTTKSYAMLELAISVVSGRPAFGELAIPTPGPVLYVIEESGRDALWRRFDALSRGRAIVREELRGLLLAPNERVKLDDADWQARLIELGQREPRPRLFIFDPLARMKAPARDESGQSDMATVIEFMRELHDATGAGVAFVHHLGHTGEHMRGSSDLESVWESRLAWTKKDGLIELASEHREAEAGPTLRYRIDWDAVTRSIRFLLEKPPDDVLDAVRAYLAKHPAASANEVAAKVVGQRSELLRAVKAVRKSGTEPPREPPPSAKRQAVTELLPQLLDAEHLAEELGVTRAAAEAIMRRLPTAQIEELRKVYVRRGDVAAYLKARTFDKDEVPA